MDLRIRLDLAYDGAQFFGWARQPGLRTVQGEVTAAIERVLRVPEPRVVVAGRTDTGVHALGQVCHVDIQRSAWDGEEAVARRLNAVLAPDVRILAAATAPPGFDARFSALFRRYEYLISDSGRLDPRARGSVLARRGRLHVAAMHEAALPLLGEHDFAAFCRARPGASSVRRILDIGVRRRADPRDSELIAVSITADAFCHSMVRSVVGALVAVGHGALPTAEVGDILRAGMKVNRFSTAPAHGLVLMQVGYPPDEELGAQASRARRFRG